MNNLAIVGLALVGVFLAMSGNLNMGENMLPLLVVAGVSLWCVQNRNSNDKMAESCFLVSIYFVSVLLSKMLNTTEGFTNVGNMNYDDLLQEIKNHLTSSEFDTIKGDLTEVETHHLVKKLNENFTSSISSGRSAEHVINIWRNRSIYEDYQTDARNIAADAQNIAAAAAAPAGTTQAPAGTTQAPAGTTTSTTTNPPAPIVVVPATMGQGLLQSGQSFGSSVMQQLAGQIQTEEQAVAAAQAAFQQRIAQAAQTAPEADSNTFALEPWMIGAISGGSAGLVILGVTAAFLVKRRK